MGKGTTAQTLSLLSFLLLSGCATLSAPQCQWGSTATDWSACRKIATGSAKPVASQETVAETYPLSNAPAVPVPNTPPPPPYRGHIPNDCLSNQAEADMKSQIPVALDLGPDAATVKYVTPMANLSSHAYFPSMNGNQELRVLQCPVQISWSNGMHQVGTFEEWEDRYGQIRVYFGDTPIRPH